MFHSGNVGFLCCVLILKGSLVGACTISAEELAAGAQANQFPISHEPKLASFQRDVVTPAFVLNPRGALVPNNELSPIIYKANQPFTVYGQKQVVDPEVGVTHQWIQTAVNPIPVFISTQEELVFLENVSSELPKWVATGRSRCPIFVLGSDNAHRLVPSGLDQNSFTRVFLYSDVPETGPFYRATFTALHRASLQNDIHWISRACIGESTAFSTWDFRSRFTDFTEFMNQVDLFKDTTFTEQFPPFPELLPLRPFSKHFDLNRTLALRYLAESDNGRFLVVALEKWGVPKFGFVDPELLPERFAGGYKPFGWKTWAIDLGEKHTSPWEGTVAIRDEVPSDNRERDVILLVATIGHELGHYIDHLNRAGHSNMMIEKPAPTDKPLIITEQSRATLERLANQDGIKFRSLYHDLLSFMTEIRMYRFYFRFALEMGLAAKDEAVATLVYTNDLIKFVTTIETFQMSSFTKIELGWFFFQLAKNDPEQLRSLISDDRWHDPTSPMFWFLPS